MTTCRALTRVSDGMPMIAWTSAVDAANASTATRGGEKDG